MTGRAPLVALLVDDEPLARRDLRLLLDERDDVAVVGEVGTVPAAVEFLGRRRVDVIFLDIRLKARSGFELLERVPRDTVVVFVTAFPEHAARAFAEDVTDYLVKPVHPDRLAQAIDRIHRTRPAAGPARLDYDSRVFLRVQGRPTVVAIDAIQFVEAAGDQVHLALGGGDRLRVPGPLREWVRRLPATRFVQIHRSYVVNLDEVVRVEPWSNYTFLVYVRNRKDPLPMSRRHARAVAGRLPNPRS